MRNYGTSPRATLRKLALIPLIACGLLSIIATGGGGGGNDTPPANDDSSNDSDTVAAVLVSPATSTLVTLGEQLQFEAGAGNAAGQTLFDKTFTWTSSDPDVATVDAMSGVVTAVIDGETTITAVTDGVPGTALVTVRLSVTRVEVSGGITLLVGESTQLEAKAFHGGIELPGRTVEWSTENPVTGDAPSPLITVDATGLVTAIATGDQSDPGEAPPSNAAVIATIEGREESIHVDVFVQPTVNTTDDVDDGTCDDVHCSLHEAFGAGEWGHAAGPILFNIPGPGPYTIRPSSQFPFADTGLSIDGYSQPGANPNTAPPDLGTNAVLMIEIDGSLGFGLIGLPEDSLVQGLVLNRGASISINGRRAVVQGNFIGTDVTGSIALGSPTGVTVHCGFADLDGTTIGGTEPAARNLISGNTTGIAHGDSDRACGGVLIQGNLIGTDASGTVALGNVTGVSVGDNNSTVGGTVPGAGNIISGNTGSGIEFSVPQSGGVTVAQGNFMYAVSAYGTDIALV